MLRAVHQSAAILLRMFSSTDRCWPRDTCQSAATLVHILCMPVDAGGAVLRGVGYSSCISQ